MKQQLKNIFEKDDFTKPEMLEGEQSEPSK